MFAAPKRSGRKPGSGAGEKRKRDEEYSKNKNSVKDRKRKSEMNPAKLQDARAYAADRAAKSRLKKKLEKGEGWNDMTKEEKNMAVDIAWSEENEKRYVTTLATV